MTPPDRYDLGRAHGIAEGRAAALRDVLAMIATQDSGWRWRIGPSACAEPVTVYVGHVWHTGNVRRVWPVLGSTVEDCLRNMVERIHSETAGHAVARAEPASDTG